MSARTSLWDISERQQSPRPRSLGVTMLDPDEPGLSAANPEWHQAFKADCAHLALLAATNHCFDDDDVVVP
jgi:hypothetical protein